MSAKIRLKKVAPTERWVVKVGSNLVCSGGIILLRSWVEQIVGLRKHHGIEVIWVTSGAIASASERTGFTNTKRTLPEKQALSAIGQPLLMDRYNLALQANGLVGAQVLVTFDDLNDKTRSENFKQTLTTLLRWGVVPLLNENDAVATEEIKFGDNDSLSVQVARCLRADRLVILTDVMGLFDSDPRVNKKAVLIKNVKAVTPQMLATTSQNAGSGRGTGGMFSKLRAAQTAQTLGIPTWLVKGDLPNILLEVAQNKSVGTHVRALPPARRT